MATRIPTFALLFLMVACAATTPPTEVSNELETESFLQGISSRYSLRLDELESDGSRSLAHQLQGGLAAGDESLNFSAALFRVDDSFGLDMVVQNQGEHSFDLHRDNIVLRDNSGHLLQPSQGFDGAKYCGLRGRTTTRLAQGVAPGTRSTDTARQRQRSEVPTPAGKHRLVFMQGSEVPVETVRSPSLDYVGTVDVEIPNPELPNVVNVPAGKSRVYWSYWTAHEVEYPVFVSVFVNDRHLLLKFGLPSS